MLILVEAPADNWHACCPYDVRFIQGYASPVLKVLSAYSVGGQESAVVFSVLVLAGCMMLWSCWVV